MGILRNSIDVIGITAEHELPDKINGQVIESADVETLFIPEDNAAVDKILQVNIELEIKSKRNIKAPLGRIIVVDGVKKIKVSYIGKGTKDKVSVVNLHIPFNSFVELPKGKIAVESIKVFVADGYFDLVSSRKIYSHILYVIDVNYKKDSIKAEGRKEKVETINNVLNNNSNEFKEIKINSKGMNKNSLSSDVPNLYIESTLDKDTDEDDIGQSIISNMHAVDWNSLIKE